MNPAEWELAHWLYAITVAALILGTAVAVRRDEKRHPRPPIDDDEPVEHGAYIRAIEAESRRNVERISRQFAE